MKVSNTVYENLIRLRDKLLDLGKRNQMLFLKSKTKTIIPIDYPSVATILERVQNGENLKLVRKIDLLTEIQKEALVKKIKEKTKDLPTPEENIYSIEDINLTKQNIPFELIKDRVSSDHIFSPVNDFELMAKASRTKSRAKTLSEDSGVDALFLVIKVIEWRESPDSKEWFKAPLLMIPTSLVRENNYSYLFNPSEDDVVVNQALKIHFEKKFNIIIPNLVENENGYDIEDFIKKTKIAITSENFKILDEVYIGIFAFSKLAMYKDISANMDSLVDNDFVKVMTGGEVEFKSSDSIIEKIDKKLDSITTSEENLTVVDADSSQLKAIQMAKAGLSFVIQGPPGTGKSQTITNLIAELIASGKKVLFVSEKQAALNVVKNNLTKVNLSEFCLVLHSTKTKKDLVISDLYNAYISERIRASNRDQEYSKRDQLRQELADYVSSIHELNNKLGLSLYGALSRYYSYEEATPFDYFNELTRFSNTESEQNISYLRDLVAYQSKFNLNLKENALFGIRTNLSSENQILQKRWWDDHIETVHNIIEVFKKLKIDETFIDNLTTSNLKKLFSQINEFTIEQNHHLLDINDEWFNIEKINKISNNLSLISKNVVILKSYREKNSLFIEDPMGIPDELIERLKTERNKWYWFLSPSYKNTLKEFTNFLVNPKGKINVLSQIDSLKTYKKTKLSYGQYEMDLGNLFQESWNGLDTDFAKVKLQIVEFTSIYQSLINFNQWLKKGKPDINEIIVDKNNYLKLGKLIFDLKVLLKEMDDQIRKILNSFDQISIDVKELNLLSLIKFSSSINLQIEDYNKWIDFLNLFDKIKELKLESFIDFVSKKDAISTTIDVYRKSFYYSWSKYLMERQKTTSGFDKTLHESKIKEFIRIDKNLLQHNRSRVRESVLSNKPVHEADLVSPQSEQSILIREFNKKRNKLSVRKLFLQIPNLIKEIKPVVMMSPITVANFLNFGDFQFDTLIFDEASQIFPYDAIGCLARAKQVIIAGDRYQLPPTNFFLTSDDINEDENEDEENNTNSADFESVLDLANSRLRNIGLQWHYRSRNEDLIAFSNQEIYQNTLITFPSIHDGIKNSGLEFVHVNNGIYDRGKSRTNRQEAEEIIKLIINHVKTTEERSLGVVTINASQQELIENLLTKYMQGNRKLESFVTGETNPSEPFFIKNIESVQGDERDTIILGIGYAKDQGGHFTMNFGPINKPGGERRLNVAITRAKINMKVVASIRGTDFKLTESSPRGVKILSDYLEFAEKGPSALKQFVKNNKQLAESGFEEDVAEFLENKGYMVEKQVGVSSFRIDLAIRDPNRPKVYALGIECDGATYHSGKTVRDRDALRQEVLERLGWKIYRIWSTDWFRINQRARADLIDAVETALGNKKSNPAPTKTEIIDKLSQEVKTEETLLKVEKLTFSKYINSNKEVERLNSLYALDYDGTTYEGFAKIFSEILRIESPVHISRFHELLKKYYNREKVTSQVVHWFDYHSSYLLERKKVKFKRDGEFFISNDQKVFNFRSTVGEVRIIGEIYYKEFTDLVEKLINHQKIVNKSSLISQISKQCNYSSFSKRVSDAIEERLNKMVEQGILVEQNQSYKLKN
jgi:superfamily I DNA and/or RNA helicase/very-short-patch-repair endonuclease